MWAGRWEASQLLCELPLLLAKLMVGGLKNVILPLLPRTLCSMAKHSTQLDTAVPRQSERWDVWASSPHSKLPSQPWERKPSATLPSREYTGLRANAVINVSLKNEWKPKRGVSMARYIRLSYWKIKKQYKALSGDIL